MLIRMSITFWSDASFCIPGTSIFPVLKTLMCISLNVRAPGGDISSSTLTIRTKQLKNARFFLHLQFNISFLQRPMFILRWSLNFILPSGLSMCSMICVSTNPVFFSTSVWTRSSISASSSFVIDENLICFFTIPLHWLEYGITGISQNTFFISISVFKYDIFVLVEMYIGEHTGTCSCSFALFAQLRKNCCCSNGCDCTSSSSESVFDSNRGKCSVVCCCSCSSSPSPLFA